MSFNNLKMNNEELEQYKNHVKTIIDLIADMEIDFCDVDEINGKGHSNSPLRDAFSGENTKVIKANNSTANNNGQCYKVPGTYGRDNNEG